MGIRRHIPVDEVVLYPIDALFILGVQCRDGQKTLAGGNITKTNGPGDRMAIFFHNDRFLG